MMRAYYRTLFRTGGYYHTKWWYDTVTASPPDPPQIRSTRAQSQRCAGMSPGGCDDGDALLVALKNKSF